MKWKEYTLHTSLEAEDAVAALLTELGAEGTEIIDALPPDEEELQAMLFTAPTKELLPPAPEGIAEGEALLRFYLREADGSEEILPQSSADADDSYTIHDRVWTPEESEGFLSDLENGLNELAEFLELGSLQLEISETEDTSWRDEWKKYYKPMEIGHFLVLPSWEEADAAQQKALQEGRLKAIRIEPGTAFGTGAHESTRLCLNALEKCAVSGARVLDIGTGSGILCLAALACGAAGTVGTELDPACVSVIEENRRLNDVTEDRLRLFMGNASEDPELRKALSVKPFDIVLSNILAPVILTLAAPGCLDPFVKKGGVWISSGIINSRSDEVREAIESNPAWSLLEKTCCGDWVSFTAKRM